MASYRVRLEVLKPGAGHATDGVAGELERKGLSDLQVFSLNGGDLSDEGDDGLAAEFSVDADDRYQALTRASALLADARGLLPDGETALYVS